MCCNELLACSLLRQEKGMLDELTCRYLSDRHYRGKKSLFQTSYLLFCYTEVIMFKCVSPNFPSWETVTIQEISCVMIAVPANHNHVILPKVLSKKACYVSEEIPQFE